MDLDTGIANPETVADNIAADSTIVHWRLPLALVCCCFILMVSVDQTMLLCAACSDKYSQIDKDNDRTNRAGRSKQSLLTKEIMKCAEHERDPDSSVASINELRPK